MNIFNSISNIFNPIFTLIDSSNFSEQEKKELELKMREIEGNIIQKAAEISGNETSGNWLQRSWRPITMLAFLVMICCDFLGFGNLDERAWTLLTIGISGYLGCRSIEKIVKGRK